jgi:hypothetical protein
MWKESQDHITAENTRYPKESLTLTLGRTREREREKERGENLGPWRRAPERREPADGGELRWPEEVRDGGGVGFKGGESSGERIAGGY